MLLVGLCTSLRLKDVVFLDSSKFNEIEGVLELIPFKTRRIGKKVRVPVHAQLLPLLKNPPEGGRYFPEKAKRYKAVLAA